MQVLISRFVPRISVGLYQYTSAYSMLLLLVVKIVKIDPPTLSMHFMVNDSPLAGIEGKAITSNALYELLLKASESDISLMVSRTEHPDVINVSGRGEMHLAILIEKIRRDGIEIAVSSPKVLYQARDDQIFEPFEEVIISCSYESSGTVIEKLSKRRATLLKMVELQNFVKLVFKCPSRGLIGYPVEFKHDTRGAGLISHSFLEYALYCGPIDVSRRGCIISMASGEITAYALADLEGRGSFFVEPGTRVYSGMVIGESSREFDIEVNPCREKILSNMRSTVKEENHRLSKPRDLSLEDVIAYMNDDEMIEITPKNVRLRKSELDANRRRQIAKL